MGGFWGAEALGEGVWGSEVSGRGEPSPLLLGPSRYTYEVAPVLLLMEEQVLAKLRELVGWSSGDGIFAPGIPDSS